MDKITPLLFWVTNIFLSPEGAVLFMSNKTKTMSQMLPNEDNEETTEVSKEEFRGIISFLKVLGLIIKEVPGEEDFISVSVEYPPEGLRFDINDIKKITFKDGGSMILYKDNNKPLFFAFPCETFEKNGKDEKSKVISGPTRNELTGIINFLSALGIKLEETFDNKGTTIFTRI